MRRFLTLMAVWVTMAAVVAVQPASAVITTPPDNVVGVYDPLVDDIEVTWDAAVSDGTLIGYDVDLLDAGLAIVDSTSTTPAVLTAAFPDVGVGPFTVRVTASDLDPSDGDASSAVINTVPGAPTGVTAVALTDTSVEVSFVAPANGGDAITGYTVTPSTGAPASGPASPITLTGLAAGSYTFTVTATNGVGDSLPGGPTSPAIELPALPGAPTAVSAAAASDTSVDVSFGAPATGGGGITIYTATASPGGLTATGATSPISVSSLPPGNYTFTVAATNATGEGPDSAATSPAITLPVPAAPGAPTALVATVTGNTTASVDATPPASNSPIVDYTITSSPGGITASSPTLPVAISGLAQGVTYTFAMTATNGTGQGPASIASNSITMPDVPDKPTGSISEPTPGTIQIDWSAPNANGSSITGYTITLNPGNQVQTVGAGETSVSFTGQPDDTTFTGTIVAANGVGDSVAEVVTFVVPGAPEGPTNVAAASVRPFSSTVQVTWTEPNDDGGSSVTEYIVILDGQTQRPSAGTLSAAFSDVSPGDHTATVQAVNARGDSTAVSTNEFEVRAFAPFTDEQAFIRQLYRDFLGREADNGGLSYWAGINNDDQSNADFVVQAFMASPEFAPRRSIARLYLAFFDRAPDKVGFDYWVTQIRTGDADLDTISNQFVLSPEFQAQYGALSDRNFVRLVYNNVLLRNPDEEGFAYWTDQLSRGLTRGEMMTLFSESAEFVDKTKPAVDVIMTYRGMLNRAPDPGGFSYWVAQVTGSPTSLNTLIAGFYQSAEYAGRITP